MFRSQDGCWDFASNTDIYLYLFSSVFVLKTVDLF